METQTETSTHKSKNSAVSTLKVDKAFSGFSVNNLDEAKDFYGEKLGLDIKKDNMGSLSLQLGANTVFIYQKENHEPATFTILNFPVNDIDKAVDQLTEMGIKFEQYAGDIQTDKKGIFRHSDSGPFMAWFKDPAGNILSVIQESDKSN